ncbi:MAG: hypothetical protein BGO67_04390 [Alphaproteobacteria bacterium 41-28]|nr:MAG: hypothetical protein BGO67_04390 [Alphaproteobacteria bacterium 41-28]
MSAIYKISKYSEPVIEKDQIIGFCSGWRKVYFKDSLDAINESLRFHNIHFKDIKTEKDNRSFLSNELHIEILLHLYELGFLEADNQQSVSWESFRNHIIAIGRAKRYRMLQEKGLGRGNLTKDILLKALLESYLLINSVSDHIITAFDNDLEFTELEALDEYLEEEYWHGRFLYYGLRKAGITEQEIGEYEMSKETKNLLNFLSDIAKDDFAAYMLCMSITESPTNCPGHITNRLREWRKIENQQIIPKQVLDIFRKHEEHDLACGHGDFSYNFNLKDKELSALRQQEISKKIDAFLHLQGEIYQGIKE